MNWLSRIWAHICYRAWTHARTREIARRQRKDPHAGVSDLTPDQARIQANEARQVLENKHFNQAFDAVRLRIDDMAETADPDDKDKCQRIIISKQLLAAVRREMVRKLEDGYMAEVTLAEIERKRSPVRMVR